MRALLIAPGSSNIEIQVETHAEITAVIGETVEVRPFTLTPPLL